MVEWGSKMVVVPSALAYRASTALACASMLRSHAPSQAPIGAASAAPLKGSGLARWCERRQGLRSVVK
jgi:hypothetical protein